jgi:very-short-patch-repair endonuclease
MVATLDFLDSIRDNWFNTNGYKVVRISVEEFKKRYFSKQGFLDLMRV